MSRRASWRAFGAGFLLAGVAAIIASIVEAIAVARNASPTFGDLLYGANIHLLMALVVTFLLRFLFWRAAARNFPWIALAGLLVAELAIVLPYWLNARTGFLPFTTTKGKLLTATAAVVGGLIGVALALLARRLAGTGRAGGERSEPSAPERRVAAAGVIGMLFALVLVIINAAIIWREAPRAERIPVRAAAAELERPHVFLILIDTLRRDHLSFYGYPRPTSPNLDRLLGESFAFAAAYTPSTWTIPSVASLFTGVYPTSHGIYGEQTWALPEGVGTLAGYFREYGYRTAALVANKVISPLNGYDRGFELFVGHTLWWGWNDRTFLEGLAKRISRPPYRGVKGLGPVINDRFFQWVDEHGDEPLFGYLHYMDPHHPYHPPPDYRERVAPGAPSGPRMTPSYQDYKTGDGCGDWECVPDPPVLEPDALRGMVANYDGEILHVDFLIGELLARLEERGLLEQSHLLLFTDHGEEFFDHRGWRHGRSIYEEISGCVMAYRPPGGVRGGTLIRRPVAMLDLPRTLCAILGFEPPSLHQGRVIPELLNQDPPREAVPVLSERPPYLYSLRLRNWKLIRRGPPSEPDWRLYDLAVDPGERHNLAAARPDTLTHLRGYLDALLASLAETTLGEGEATADPRALERLRALGYIK